jgi:hypothetical protein
MFKAFYPFEMIAITLAFAFVPYLIIRGPANRIARWWTRERLNRRGR